MGSGGAGLQRKVSSAAGLCRMCEQHAKLTKHRVVPGREGGPYEARNVVPLCWPCHAKVERDEKYRSFLRELLWPEELSYAVSRMGWMWFDEVYPPSTARAEQARADLAKRLLTGQHRATKTVTTNSSDEWFAGLGSQQERRLKSASGWHAFDRQPTMKDRISPRA